MSIIPVFVTREQLAVLISMTPAEVDLMVQSGELPKPATAGKWRWSTVDHYLSTDEYSRGTVYFVESGNYIKIGFTTDPEGRLSQISGFMPEPVTLLHRISAPKDTETDLHRKFKHLRVNGEWFRKEPEILEYIQTLKNNL